MINVLIKILKIGLTDWLSSIKHTKYEKFIYDRYSLAVYPINTPKCPSLKFYECTETKIFCKLNMCNNIVLVYWSKSKINYCLIYVYINLT